MNKKKNLILYIVLFILLLSIVGIGLHARNANEIDDKKINDDKNGKVIDKNKVKVARTHDKDLEIKSKKDSEENKDANGKKKIINKDIKNDIKEVEFKYYDKTYDEIIEILDTKKFDKNQFNGKFVIFQVNKSDYGSTTPLENLKKVLATWDDITNYNSYLYKNLHLNNKEIEHYVYRLYGVDSAFVLEAWNKDSLSKYTIKEAFDNNNIVLEYNSPSRADISSSNVIEVPDKIRKKYGENNLGIFVELLGNPSKIFQDEDTKNDLINACMDGGGSSCGFDYDFDFIKDYVLYWEYDNYVIRMNIVITYFEDKIVFERIGSIRIINKNCNSVIMRDYNSFLSSDEKVYKQKTN